MHRPPNTEAQKQPDHEQIMSALSEVLESDKFTAAPQMSAFLRYVVEQAASGNMTRIKAYTVAIDALGKPDSFDPQNDPVVRVLAGRLRAALSSYYDANPGSELRITMRPGSYVPSFVPGTAIENVEKTNTAIGNKISGLDAKTASTISTVAATPELKKTASAQRHQESFNTDAISGNAHDTNLLENTPPVSSQAAAQHVSVANDRDFLAPLRHLFRAPVIGVALLALGLIVGSQLTQRKAAPVAENAALDSTAVRLVQRDRPEQISLFVSALEQGNTLNDQLNTMLSGVFSESNALYVYRVFDSNSTRQHWPEDYLVSVDVLPMSTETRVSVQLVEAQTGRVSHSENIALSENAADGLNVEELATLTEFARELISEHGPLFSDYKTKLAAAN